jgi:NAD(P)-dependent dehydrogenase (short-subunit alcohol dehydrogenase family)
MSVVIVGGDSTLANALAAPILAQGTSVVTVGGASITTDHEHLPCDLSAAGEIEDALRQAESILGESPGLIRLGVTATPSVSTELASLSLEGWVARAETPLREAYAFHQATQRFTAGRSGRVLVIVPTVGLSGGPGFVPLATTAEADRSLVKALARVSGERGVTINCVAVTSALLTGSDGDPDRTGLPRPAHHQPDWRDVAAVIVGLLGPAFEGITGQTIAVDGGRWMSP